MTATAEDTEDTTQEEDEQEDDEEVTEEHHPPILLSAKLEALLGVKIILIVGIMLYVILTPPSRGRLYTKGAACDDILCYDVSQQMLTIMNLSLDPCDDFYSFVCGQWADAHPGVSDQEELMQTKVNALVRKALREHSVADNQGPLDKAVIAYDLCTEVFMQAKEDTAVLRGLLRDLHTSWPSTGNSTAGLLDVMVSLSLSYHLPVLVDVDLVPSGGTKRIISIGTNRKHEEWLEHRATYLDGDTTMRCIQEFAEAIGGGCATDYKDFAEQVLRADVDIGVRWTAGTLQHETPRLLTFADLDAMNYSSREWLDAINANLPNSSVLTDKDELLLADKEVLAFVNDLRADFGEETGLAVVVFYALRQLAPVSSYQMIDALFGRPFDKTVIANYVASTCVKITSDVTSFAVANLVFGEVLQEADLDQVYKMVAAVSGQMEDTYNSTDADTARRIHILRSLVAWPPGFNNTDNQAKFFSYLPKFETPIAKSYLHSLHSLRDREKMQLKHPFNNPQLYEEDQVATLLRVEPMYNPPRHEMLVPPAAILPPLFLTGNAPLSYGALGHIIGRELWLALAVGSGDSMANKTVVGQEECLRDFYNEQGVKPDDVAMQESVVDSLSMGSALGAYLASGTNDTTEVAGLNGERLFFVASCFKLCAKDGSRGSGRYASPRVRCNGPLMLAEAFGKAFSCDSKDKMVAMQEAYSACAVLGNATAEPPIREHINHTWPIPGNTTVPGSATSVTSTISANVTQHAT